MKLAGLAVLAVFIADSFLTWRQLWRAEVCVANASGAELAGVRVGAGRGASREIGRLADGRTGCAEVFPSGEASVFLSFDSPRKRGNLWQGSYIEGSGGYRVTLTVGPDGSVRDGVRLVVIFPIMSAVEALFE
mgnify:CR=1 FL=1